MTDTNSAFLQPPMPGYSPFPTARQDSPFLQTPGVQGLQEGVAGGQGFSQTPSSEFFASGTEGTAPPSSIAADGSSMWSKFSGSGGAPSSLAAPTAQQPAMPSMQPSMAQQPLGMQQPAPMQPAAMQPAPMQQPMGQAAPRFAGATAMAGLLGGQRAAA